VARVADELNRLRKLIKIPWRIEFVDCYIPEDEQEDKTIYIHIDLEDKL
jgi:intergrase/recombinase